MARAKQTADSWKHMSGTDLEAAFKAWGGSMSEVEREFGSQKKESLVRALEAMIAAKLVASP
jgi:hypothetical protein